MSHLRLADVEEAAAARALAAEAAQLAPREPDVAGNQQDGGRQAQQLLLPAELVGVGDGHPGGGRPVQVLLRLLHLALKAVNAADVEVVLVLALLRPRGGCGCGCLHAIRLCLPADGCISLLHDANSTPGSVLPFYKPTY